MATAAQKYTRLKDYFDRININYRHDAKENKFLLNLPLDCKLRNSDVFINYYDEYVQVRAFFALSADEDCRQKVMEYITRVNCLTEFGHFNLDLDNNSIYYSLSAQFEDISSLSDDRIADIVSLPIYALEEHADRLLAVMFGLDNR